MTAGISAAAANDLIDSFVAAGPLWAQLHTGDPGADGTANVAGETTRKECSFPAAVDGSTATDAPTAWTSVSDTETYRYVSYWTGETVGDFGASKALASPRSVTAGDDFQFDTGDLVISLTPVAA